MSLQDMDSEIDMTPFWGDVFIVGAVSIIIVLMMCAFWAVKVMVMS